MRLQPLAVAAAVALYAGFPNAGQAAGGFRQVNVSADSLPGWTPTEDQERMAREAVEHFLAALDGGRAAEAYGLLDETNRDLPQSVFAERALQFNTLAGAVRERRMIKTTWTRDPLKAPAPGVYAAVDLVSRFERVDRHCGYIAVRQAPAGGEFRVVRQQDVYLDNATASRIAQRGSPSDVEKAWATASANCPNYPAQARAIAAAPAPLQEQAGGFDYATVAAALSDLKARRGVVFSTQNGWAIATDEAARTLWSFAPSGDPAYPAVVKREVTEAGGMVTVNMKVLCEASKAACDNLVRTFQAMNNAIMGKGR